MTLPLGLVALTGLGTGLAGIALRSWAARLAATDSGWLARWFVALLAALGGIGSASLARSYAEWLAFAVLSTACALLVVIDLAAFRLPDRIVGPMYPLLFSLLGLAAVAEGDWRRLVRAAVAGLILLVGYFVLAFVNPQGLGLGDVKLAGLLGMFLGWLGWSHALVGTLAAFALNAGCAVVLLAVGKADRRTDLAFGPWMVAGAALGAALGPGVVG